MQTIHLDREKKLVDVRVSGFFAPEDVTWTAEEVRAAIRTLGDDVGNHVTLYDASAAQIAPPATIDVLQQGFAHPAVRELWARKVAFVTPSALGRMQIQRLRQARPDIGIFGDRESAMAWLFA